MKSKRHIDYFFWFSLMIFFDTGGFFAGFLGSNIFGRVKYYDLGFFFMTLSYILSQDIPFRMKIDQHVNIIRNYLIIISLFFFFVTGILVPSWNGYEDFSFFIQKNRQFFYALPLLIYIYHFSIRSLEVFYKQIVWLAVIVLSAFFITLLTGLDLVPLVVADRYGSGNRVFMISYGLIHWVIPMGIIVLVLGKRIQIPYKSHLLIGLVFMILTIIITLTRREYLRLGFMSFMLPFLIAHFSGTSIIPKMKKFIAPIAIGGLLLVFLFPSYIDLGIRIVSDVYYLLLTGADSSGVLDSRVAGSNEMTIVNDIIGKNWFWGIGYYPAQWSDIVDMKRRGIELGVALDASSEVPIYGAFMRLGLIGLVVPFFFYIFVLRTFIKSFNFTQKGFNYMYQYPIELVIIVTILYYLIAKFTIEVFALFGEFYSPYDLPLLSVLLGVLLGAIKRIQVFKYIATESTATASSNHIP